MSQPSPKAHPDAALQAGIEHHRAGRLDEADRLYRKVLATDAQNPDALHLLGMVAFQSGREDEAVRLIQKAIAIKPDAPSYHSNLGNVFRAQGKLNEAGVCYQRALVLKPDLAEAHLHLGHIFRSLGDADLSLICYNRALAIDGAMAEAHAARAMALLLKGDFAAGWAEFEHRFRARDFETPMRQYGLPLWDGRVIPKGRVLLWGEQGIGDEIMFAGLVSDVMRLGQHFALDCDRRLQLLFARSFPDVEVRARGEFGDSKVAGFAAHLPTGSLPALYRNSLESFAATTLPYLKADPARKAHFRTRYDDGRKVIGLAWFTRSKSSGRERSIALEEFAPLFTIEGIRWVSLQYGDPEELKSEVADLPLLIDREVDQLTNLDDFAAQVGAMDLVITIDNSTAHLAGALGVPTWLLLPFASDWRWLQTREDSPWYPSLRLFRQQQIGGWLPVIDRVRAELENLR